jgi:hypothetical protein
MIARTEGIFTPTIMRLADFRYVEQPPGGCPPRTSHLDGDHPNSIVAEVLEKGRQRGAV